MTINTEHNVTLTEGEISVILNNLEEKYGHLLDGEIPEEVQTIFSKLEGSVDAYYEKVELAQSRQPSMEWDDDFYDSLSEGKDQPQPVEEVSTVHTRKDMDLL